MNTLRSEMRHPAKTTWTLSVRCVWQFILGSCFWFSICASATDWTIEDLDGQSPAYSVGAAINARGQVTGTTYLQNRLHAFLFDGIHNSKFIGTLPGTTDSEGYGINARGQIVGDSGRNSEGLWHAMFYDPSQGMIDLDPSGVYSNGYSSASSINFGGLAVGLGTYAIPPPDNLPPDGCPDYYYGNGGNRALLWGGGVYDLGSLPSFYPWSAATGINDNGLIVGWSGTTPLGPYSHYEPDPRGSDYPPVLVCDTPPLIIHAAFYDGSWHDLGSLGGSYSVANAVNNRGQIVGGSKIGGDVTFHAFVYDGGNMRDINPPGVASSVADGINDDGLIVGQAGDPNDPTTLFGSFFYDGAMRDINTFPEVLAAGWNMAGAFGINDSGQITGYGVNSNGQYHAYRMHPQSTSRYMRTVDVNTLYNLGCSQTNQRGVTILDFGQPRYDGQDYGASIFRTDRTFATISDIESAVRAFLSGYYVCNGNPGHGVITVAVGTSNLGRDTTPGHAQAWAQMIARLNDFISSSPNWTDRLSVVGASDIELNWNSPANTIAWVDSYAQTPNVKYINYGDAGGCPPASTSSCNNGWSQSNVQYISWGNPASVGPVPQIYKNVSPARPINALQWVTLATLNGSIPRSFKGALTEWQACRDPGHICGGATNTPPQAWQQLMDALYNASPTMAPIIQPALFSTDITWQN